MVVRSLAGDRSVWPCLEGATSLILGRGHAGESTSTDVTLLLFCSFDGNGSTLMTVRY